MAQSTGPVLAAGGAVIFNAVIIQQRDPRSQTRVAVGTLITAAALGLAERPMPRVAVAASWLILATVLLVRVEPNTPSPVESFMQYINS